MAFCAMYGMGNLQTPISAPSQAQAQGPRSFTWRERAIGLRIYPFELKFGGRCSLALPAGSHEEAQPRSGGEARRGEARVDPRWLDVSNGLLSLVFGPLFDISHSPPALSINITYTTRHSPYLSTAALQSTHKSSSYLATNTNTPLQHPVQPTHPTHQHQPWRKP
jgi:hypothetical protein